MKVNILMKHFNDLTNKALETKLISDYTKLSEGRQQFLFEKTCEILNEDGAEMRARQRERAAFKQEFPEPPLSQPVRPEPKQENWYEKAVGTLSNLMREYPRAIDRAALATAPDAEAVENKMRQLGMYGPDKSTVATIRDREEKRESKIRELEKYQKDLEAKGFKSFEDITIPQTELDYLETLRTAEGPTRPGAFETNMPNLLRKAEMKAYKEFKERTSGKSEEDLRKLYTDNPKAFESDRQFMPAMMSVNVMPTASIEAEGTALPPELRSGSVRSLSHFGQDLPTIAAVGAGLALAPTAVAALTRAAAPITPAALSVSPAAAASATGRAIATGFAGMGAEQLARSKNPVDSLLAAGMITPAIAATMRRGKGPQGEQPTEVSTPPSQTPSGPEFKAPPSPPAKPKPMWGTKEWIDAQLQKSIDNTKFRTDQSISIETPTPIGSELMPRPEFIRPGLPRGRSRSGITRMVGTKELDRLLKSKYLTDAEKSYLEGLKNKTLGRAIGGNVGERVSKQYTEAEKAIADTIAKLETPPETTTDPNYLSRLRQAMNITGEPSYNRMKTLDPELLGLGRVMPLPWEVPAEQTAAEIYRKEKLPPMEVPSAERTKRIDSKPSTLSQVGDFVADLKSVPKNVVTQLIPDLLQKTVEGMKKVSDRRSIARDLRARAGEFGQEAMRGVRAVAENPRVIPSAAGEIATVVAGMVPPAERLPEPSSMGPRISAKVVEPTLVRVNTELAKIEAASRGKPSLQPKAPEVTRSKAETETAKPIEVQSGEGGMNVAISLPEYEPAKPSRPLPSGDERYISWPKPSEPQPSAPTKLPDWAKDITKPKEPKIEAPIDWNKFIVDIQRPWAPEQPKIVKTEPRPISPAEVVPDTPSRPQIVRPSPPEIPNVAPPSISSASGRVVLPKAPPEYPVAKNIPVIAPSIAPPDEETPRTLIPLAPPEVKPSKIPVQTPPEVPVQAPSQAPSQAPVQTPSEVPAQVPSQAPSRTPSEVSTAQPIEIPSNKTKTPPDNVPVSVPTPVVVNTKVPDIGKPPAPAPAASGSGFGVVTPPVPVPLVPGPARPGGKGKLPVAFDDEDTEDKKFELPKTGLDIPDWNLILKQIYSQTAGTLSR
jgi:hypothetical protein